MKIGISELVKRIGDDNIEIQNLDTCADKMNMSKGVTRITFGTDEPIDLDGTKRLGLVLWLPRDAVKAALAASMTDKAVAWQIRYPPAGEAPWTEWRAITKAQYDRISVVSGSFEVRELFTVASKPNAGKESESIPLHPKALAAVAGIVLPEIGADRCAKCGREGCPTGAAPYSCDKEGCPRRDPLIESLMTTPPITPQDKAAPSTLDAGTWRLVIPDALPDVSGECGDTYVGDISAFEDCAYNAGFNACREQIIEAASTQNAERTNEN